MPRLMEAAGEEMKEVFCGSYTTFVITSGFNHFLSCYDLSFFAEGGDLLSVGKGKGGRLGRATAEDSATVGNLLNFLFLNVGLRSARLRWVSRWLEEQQVRPMQLLSPKQGRFGSGAAPGGDYQITFNLLISSLLQGSWQAGRLVGTRAG